MPLPRTLGELNTSEYSQARIGRSVKDEIRANLIRRLERREPIFPGIVGYDDSVIPQLVNALLSRHNFILLGLRGQAKSRILRDLAGLLDHVPHLGTEQRADKQPETNEGRVGQRRPAQPRAGIGHRHCEQQEDHEQFDAGHGFGSLSASPALQGKYHDAPPPGRLL